MLRRVLGEDILLEIAPWPQPVAVEADPTQIEQVIMNLAINARDAMPDGGKLAIKTAIVVIDEAYCKERAEATPEDMPYSLSVIRGPE